MNRKSLVVAFLALAASWVSADAQQPTEKFWLGADISGVTELEGRGQKFYTTQGEERDLYALMKDYGINGVRLRVWVDPKDKYCAPEDVLQMALRAKDAGLPVMVDFHYSDWWADPGKQNMPERWKNLSYEQLKGAVAEHTASTLEMLRNAGVDVPWVQVGNETTNGMMWPIAQLPDNMKQYAGLTKVGYEAVKAIYPEAQVIVHLDNGWDEDLYNRVFDGLKENGAKWDMIGMSLYPYWSLQSGQVKTEDEALTRCVKNINKLYEKFGTPIMVTEIGVEANEPVPGKAFIAQALKAFKEDTHGNCKGVWYWAPEADGVLDGYKLGAFQNRRPTIIMDAFKEASH